MKRSLHWENSRLGFIEVIYWYGNEICHTTATH